VTQGGAQACWAQARRSTTLSGGSAAPASHPAAAAPLQSLLFELSANETARAEEGAGSSSGSPRRAPEAGAAPPHASSSGVAAPAAGNCGSAQQQQQQPSGAQPEADKQQQADASLLGYMPSGRGNPFVTLTGEIEEIEEVPLPAGPSGRRGGGGEGWGPDGGAPAAGGVWARAKAAASECWESAAVQVRVFLGRGAARGEIRAVGPRSGGRRLPKARKSALTPRPPAPPPRPQQDALAALGLQNMPRWQLAGGAAAGALVAFSLYRERRTLRRGGARVAAGAAAALSQLAGLALGGAGPSAMAAAPRAAYQ
jgi:hypothetical protein